MVVDVFIAFVLLSMIWVYLDASLHKIGRVPGQRHFPNLSAGGWATVTGVLWIIGFPTYLSKRSALIGIARTHPVESTARIFKVCLFTAIAVGVIGLTAAERPEYTLPDCDDPDVMNFADNLIKDLPLIQRSGLEIHGIAAVTDVSDESMEMGDESTEDKRVCSAKLTGAKGTALIAGLGYSVYWADRSKGQVWVHIVVE